MLVTKATDSTDKSDQIRFAEYELNKAQLAHDIDALDKLLHDDLLFVGPDGAVFTKAMDIELHRTSTMRIDKMESTVEHINVIGDNAVSIVRSDVKGAVGELPVEGSVRYVRVWKSVDRQWTVIGGSITQLPN